MSGPVSEARLKQLLEPYLRVEESASSIPPDLHARLLTYLELLLRWNARTNLTAVRGPEEIVTRHFGESLFAARRLESYLHHDATVLDLGSGAGFPGLPLQILYPDAVVTLAESQGKKASFLREVVRSLGLRTEVWAARAEEMPTDRRFNLVTLRAVDRMESARDVAASRLGEGGVIAELTVSGSPELDSLVPVGPEVSIPGSQNRVIRLWAKP